MMLAAEGRPLIDRVGMGSALPLDRLGCHNLGRHGCFLGMGPGSDFLRELSKHLAILSCLFPDHFLKMDHVSTEAGIEMLRGVPLLSAN